MKPILYWTPWTIATSIVVVLAALCVCFIAWRRSGFSRSSGILEVLRLVLIVMVIVTLNQPEGVREILPDQRPTIAVLYDESNSMTTEDVISSDVVAKPRSRTGAIQPLFDETLWVEVQKRMDVVFQPFSSSRETNPKSATNLQNALVSAMDKNANLRGVVLASDGDWNVGGMPAVAAEGLRAKQVPVFAIAVGSQTRLPDVELVALDAPTFGVQNKPIRIPFVIESALPTDYATTVELTTSDGEQITKKVVVEAKSTLRDTVVWTPRNKGEIKLTMKVPLAPKEINPKNNQQTAPVSIRQESLKVLLIETYPRWEYRYLRNALERDPGVDVQCLLFHPSIGKLGGGRGYLKTFPNDAALQKFDVVLLGDVGTSPGQLTVDQCERLKQLVQNHAAGLIFLPGFRGNQATLLQTELSALYPVVMDDSQPRGWGSRSPSQFELTEKGRLSLLTRLENRDEDNARIWEQLPGFQWHAAAVRAKAGSEVLATHKSETTRFGRVPLIVTRTYGTGKILFMGTDGAWRWREGVEDRYHYRFWGQVARWMAYQRQMSSGKSIRLFYSPDRPRARDTITLNVNVMSPTGEPLQTGTVVVQVESPSGKTQTVRLTSGSGESWGLFTGTLVPDEPGQYRLVTNCRENGATLTTMLTVQGVTLEKVGRPARYEVLEEIAKISRGRRVGVTDIPSLVNEIAALPEPDPVLRRFRLWSNPWWGGLIIGLLGVFWIGRKISGTI